MHILSVAWLQDVLVDLDLIESDLERVRGLAASISQKSGDAGVRETMATTLRVLTEQHESLKQRAQDKKRQVQVGTGYTSHRDTRSDHNCTQVFTISQ